MRNKILIIILATFIVLLGLSSCVLVLFHEVFSSVSTDFIYQLYSYAPIKMYWIQYYDLDEMIAPSIVNLIFNILLVIGIFQYVLTPKRSGILRFILSLLFIQFSIGFLYRIYGLWDLYNYLETHPSAEYSIPLIILGYLISLFWISSTYFSLKYLGKKDIYQEVAYGEGENVYRTIVEQSNKNRFWNWILDSICFTLVFMQLIINFGITNELRDNWHDKLIFYGLSFLLFSIAYVLSEFLFQATPAKFLTNSRVTTEEGEQAVLGKIVIRTVARWIPFDSITFLVDRGLHDRLSKTHVVKLDKESIWVLERAYT